MSLTYEPGRAALARPRGGGRGAAPARRPGARAARPRRALRDRARAPRCTTSSAGCSSRAQRADRPGTRDPAARGRRRASGGRAGRRPRCWSCCAPGCRARRSWSSTARWRARRPLIERVFERVRDRGRGRPRTVPFGHTALGRGLLALARCALLDRAQASARTCSTTCGRPGLLERPEVADELEADVRREGCAPRRRPASASAGGSREIDALRAAAEPRRELACQARRLLAAPHRRRRAGARSRRGARRAGAVGDAARRWPSWTSSAASGRGAS